jgi:hypothetical protein
MGDFLLPRVAPIFSLKGRDSLWSVAGSIPCARTSMKRGVTVVLLSQTPTKVSQFYWHVVTCSAIFPPMKHHVDNPRKQATYGRIKCKVSRCTFQTPAGILGFPKDPQQLLSKQRHLQIILENGSQLHMAFNFVYRISSYSFSIDKNSSCRCCRTLFRPPILVKKRSTNKRRT